MGKERKSFAELDMALEYEQLKQEYKQFQEEVADLLETAEHYLDRSHFFGGSRTRLENKISSVRKMIE